LGRTLVVTLDTRPPSIAQSNVLPEVPVGSVANGHALTRPVSFPWTVSLTEPLLLYVIATTRHYYCTVLYLDCADPVGER
jgi:hypothetical protein